MAPTRERGKLSRKGCLQCKLRKVKCDETKPQCLNCSKRHRPCTFPIQVSGFQNGQTDFRSSTLSASSSKDDAWEDVVAGVGTMNLAHHPPTLNFLHLELLHNYSTSTSYTISRNTELQTIWRIEVPKIAFAAGNDFVLRALLAVSAYHLASESSGEMREFYEAQAVEQHSIALNKAAPIIPTVTKENASALFLLSTFTSIIAITTTARPLQSTGAAHNAAHPEYSILEWMELTRGGCNVIKSSWMWLLSGVLAPLLRIALKETWTYGTPPPEQMHLDSLTRLIQARVADPTRFRVLTTTVEDLKKSFHAFHSPPTAGCELPSVFVWPVEVSEEYLQLLRQKDQEAVVIFAHFCVLLKRLDSYWWCRGLADRLVGFAWDLLDEEYREAITWPMDMTIRASAGLQMEDFDFGVDQMVGGFDGDMLSSVAAVEC